jgi:outer membrane cobalamin receptor
MHKLKYFLMIAAYLLLCASSWAKGEELKIQIYGYPEHSTQTQSIQQFNPLQPENLSLKTPGLTIAKLGALGQKTSIRFNSFASGDLTLLFDGFEISDPSDPSEGFELSSFLMTPQFDFKFSNSDKVGVFSRQAGGVLAIDPGMTTKSYVHSGGGSDGQGLLSVQKNNCSDKQCLSLGLGGTFADGISASTNSNVGTNTPGADQASLGFLSLSWHRQLSSQKMIKIRAHSQYSNIEIDDYDDSFVFRDDPNAKLETLNHFLGVSYINENNQYFFENTFSDRILNNEPDAGNPISKDERYKVFRSKIRGAHTLYQNPKAKFVDLNLYWYGQSVLLETSQTGNALPEDQSKELSRLEVGLQLDQKIKLKSVAGVSSVNVNSLEGFSSSYGVSQSVETALYQKSKQALNLQTHFGLNERRPSLFQLFDPQFGNSDLANEQLFYLRPKIKWTLNSKETMQHNISLDYYWENIDSRVVFITDTNSGLVGYQNSGRLNSNSLIFDYALKSLRGSSHFFFRQSLDAEDTLRSLPWLARQEWGLGQSLRTAIAGRTLEFSLDIKWLLGMYSPSQKQLGNLVQSQGTISYQYDTNDRISLQLNNLFNDKKIWDEGFQRQPLSWMLSLTKTI